MNAAAGAPTRSTLRDSESGAPLLFGYFLLAKQEKVTSRRATPGEVKIIN
jgi:hypothetical protein